MLRPIGGFAGADHPAFTGSNPNFNPINGPFDVDNDGDGIRESVWIDVGFPVQTAADGRSYKPLAAILCIDLDGRLNVNAHGNIADVDQNVLPSSTAISGAELQFQANFPNMSTAAIAGVADGTTQYPTVQRGQGYGPAEISLFPFFSAMGNGSAPSVSNDPRLTSYTRLLAARYGEANSNIYDPILDATSVLSNYNSSSYMATSPQKLSGFPGKTNYSDPLASLQFAQFPGGTEAANTQTCFASPTDVFGRGGIMLDKLGRPIAPEVTRSFPSDSPYEFNLSRKAGRNGSVYGTPPTVDVSTPANAAATTNPIDKPFTPAELERILRMYDVDAADLPSRLGNLLSGGTPPPSLLRGMVTTDSYDVPVAPMLPTLDAAVIRANKHFAPGVAAHCRSAADSAAAGRHDRREYTGANRFNVAA